MDGEIEAVNETSSLLGQQPASKPIVPNGPETTTNGEAESQQQNGDTVEREGMPEVAAKLRLLVPAVGIGVGDSLTHPFKRTQTKGTARSISVQLTSCWPLRHMPRLVVS